MTTAPALTMTKAELYKIRHHRLPFVVTAIGVVAAVAPAVYYLFRAPSEASFYLEAATAAASIYLILAAAIFGGWMLGHEYRQETLRRVVAVDARRGRLLAAKAGAGLLGFAAMFATVIGSGIGSAALAAAVNGDDLVTTDLGRAVGAGAAGSFIALAVAFGASAILRSDTYATLFSLGAVVVFSPILALIPTVGDFTLGSLSDAVSTWILDAETPSRGATVTLVALAAWIAGIGAAGLGLFSRRDI